MNPRILKRFIVYMIVFIVLVVMTYRLFSQPKVSLKT